jgi:hypothetical protein
MTARSDRARAIARRVADRIAGVVPAGLGSSSAPWDAVDAASGRFLQELERWEASDDQSQEEYLRELVTAAANELIAAWRSVAESIDGEVDQALTPAVSAAEVQL